MISNANRLGNRDAYGIDLADKATGAVFSFIGSSYVAAHYLPARMYALFMGLTQCLGMLGAAFGSKPVQMAIGLDGSFHVSWQHVWFTFAVIGFLLAVVIWLVMPRDSDESSSHAGALSVSGLLHPFAVVLRNAQSWLSGIIGGLLFVPTTIGAMVWATSFLHNGQHISMASAASDASMVPIGWVIGCPLLGYISDGIGRRKPVLVGGAVVMLAAGLTAVYVPEPAVPRYLVPLLLGIGSGAAMIPFTMIKEANPSEAKGTAAGVMNFLVFLTTGIMSPFVSHMMAPASAAPLPPHEFQQGFLPLIAGIVLAIVLSFIIRETGTAQGKRSEVGGRRPRGLIESGTVGAPAVERKLAAILSADVEGYSRLMGQDEVATVRTLTAYRETSASFIQRRRGRVVDSPGDNLLAQCGGRGGVRGRDPAGAHGQNRRAAAFPSDAVPHRHQPG